MERVWRFLRKEFRELLPPTIFFFIALGLLTLSKRLLLEQYGISFSDVAGVFIGALVAGKVVLIADALPFINRYTGRPRIFAVLWKTAIYVLAAMLVRLAELGIPLVAKYGSLGEAVARTVDGFVWPHFWIFHLWLTVLAFVYCLLRELAGAIGKDEILRLFFGVEPSAASKQPSRGA